MEKEKLESLLIDLIDGKIDSQSQKEVEKILATDPEARMLLEQLRQVTDAMDKSSDVEPRRGMKDRFLRMLDEEHHSIVPEVPRGKQVSFQPAFFRMAAAVALVMSGVAVGYWVNKNQNQADDIRMLKQMMLSMMENPQSASKRMQGVNVALTMGSADDEVVAALVNTMNEDLNTNVRLAALDALSQFQHEPGVRSALIRSLGTQKDPVVQIALIQLLVKMKETGVVNELERIINDSTTITPVKDEAHSGILRLS